MNTPRTIPFRSRTRLVLATAICASVPSAAIAQGAAEPAGLEEIVVTAQKRSESLQDVPVSVTALTAERLERLKLDTPADIVSQIPNLKVNAVVGDATPVFSLRGVSMFDYSLNQSSPVASYVDEVYRGNFTLFGVELYDLERVEVLRGPQGTLYGKNTTGGAINLITRKPGFETEGNLRAGIGNYSRTEASGAVQGALIEDQLAGRLAFTYTKMDGAIDNVLPGAPDLQAVDQYAFRGSLLFRPREDIEAVLRANLSRQDAENYAIIAGSVAPFGIGYSGYFRTQDGTETGSPLDDDELAEDADVGRTHDTDAINLTVNWEISEGLTLTSISSWDKGELYNPEGVDGAPYKLFDNIYYGKTEQITQDLRIASSGRGRIDYIAGIYFQDQDITNTSETQILLEGSTSYQDCAFLSFEPGYGYTVGASLNPACIYANEFDQSLRSWSIYGDATIMLAEGLRMRLGLRQTRDEGEQENARNLLLGSDREPLANISTGSFASGLFQPTIALPNTPGREALLAQTVGQDFNESKLTGRIGLDYDIGDDTMVYVNYSKGYRSASFNAQFLFTSADFSTVDPETIDAWELGFKTQVLDNRLQLNGSLFHYVYENQQLVDVRPDGRQPLINLGETQIEGGELEVLARPAESLMLRAGIGFLDTEIREGAIADGLVDVSGNELPNAPSLSSTVSAEWRVLQGDMFDIDVMVDWSYSSRQYFELLNQRRISQEAVSTIDARVALSAPYAGWELALWGRNLGDEFIITNAIDLQALGFDYRHRNLPRTFGLEGMFRF